MKDSKINLDDISAQFEGISAKISTVLRHIDINDIHSLIHNTPPRVGDVVLAKVAHVGDKKTLQSPDGRNVELHEGDKVLLAYGNRYAVEEYEAFVPENLKKCHLVSSGGVASLIKNNNGNFDDFTTIKPMGLISNKAGKVMNLKDYAFNSPNLERKSTPIVIAILGTGMDAGKTTSGTAIVKGLSRTGKQVGYAKMTGTGLSSDIHQPQDAGAVEVCDFVDMGYPSTYEVPTEDLIKLCNGLIVNLALRGSEIIIMEIADGVLQSDNKKLFRSDEFKSKIDGVFLAADSGLSAITALNELKKYDFPVIAAGGRMMLAPLTVSELVNNIDQENLPQLGILDIDELQKKGTANKIIQLLDKSGEDINPHESSDLETPPTPPT